MTSLGVSTYMSEMCKFGILTVSDRASTGVYEDRSGPAIEAFLSAVITSPYEIHKKIISDNIEDIEKAIVDFIDVMGCSLILTTGGTGPSKRDVTPEATISVCDKILPGFGEQMRNISLKYVPTAILSRQTAGIRSNSLVINLPGAPKSIDETLYELFPAVPYCIDLINGPYITTDKKLINSFRPRHAVRE